MGRHQRFYIPPGLMLVITVGFGVILAAGLPSMTRRWTLVNTIGAIIVLSGFTLMAFAAIELWFRRRNRSHPLTAPDPTGPIFPQRKDIPVADNPEPPPDVTVRDLAGFYTESGTLYIGRVVDIKETGWFARALLRPLWRVDDNETTVDIADVEWTIWVDAAHLILETMTAPGPAWRPLKNCPGDTGTTKGE